MEKWHYILNGQNLGPVAREEILALLQSGQLKPDALVWKQGLAQWQPLSATFPEVKSAAATPPPFAPPPVIPPVPPASGKSGIRKGCIIAAVVMVFVGFVVCAILAGIFWIVSSMPKVSITHTMETTDSASPRAAEPSSLIPSIKEIQAIALKEYKTYGTSLQALSKGQILEVYTNSILVGGKRRDFVTWQFEVDGTLVAFIYVRCLNQAQAEAVLEDAADKFQALARKHTGNSTNVALTTSVNGSVAGAVAIQGSGSDSPPTAVEKRLGSFLNKALQLVGAGGSPQ